MRWLFIMVILRIWLNRFRSRAVACPQARAWNASRATDPNQASTLSQNHNMRGLVRLEGVCAGAGGGGGGRCGGHISYYPDLSGTLEEVHHILLRNIVRARAPPDTLTRNHSHDISKNAQTQSAKATILIILHLICTRMPHYHYQCFSSIIVYSIPNIIWKQARNIHCELQLAGLGRERGHGTFL